MANLQDIVNRSEVGAIKPWTKAAAPAGYLLCDGSAVSRSTYADLFAVIASTYGNGDGSTTFNVPNLQGKMPQGYDGNTYNLAGTGGANTVTVAVTNNQAVTVTGNISNTSLTTAQLSSHNHNTNYPNPFYTNGADNEQAGVTRGANTDATSNLAMNNAGSGTGHNHAHTLSGTLTGTVTGSGTNSFSPFVVVNYIIKH
jgi:microcystin-dependent protein